MQNNIDIALMLDLVPIKALSHERCQELAQKAEVFQEQEGGVLFAIGDVSAHIVYVLQGKVELVAEDGAKRIVVGGSKMATLPLDQHSVHQVSAYARSEVVYLKVDSNLLDIMLTWEQSGGYEVQEIGANSDGGDDDWMARVLSSRVFSKIPPANIQKVFMKMGTVHLKAGEAVIRQGEEGDIFYIVREGMCAVERKTKRNPEGVVLAKLGVGDHFGEDALISGGKRNASVIMLTDGVMMTLSKADFLELLNEPLLRRVDLKQALQMDGAVWVDVRLPSEYQARHVKNSINLPLLVLRDKVAMLDPERAYVVYCDTGRRSSAATYLLAERGFNASVLIHGLDKVPAEFVEGQ